VAGKSKGIDNSLREEGVLVIANRAKRFYLELEIERAEINNSKTIMRLVSLNRLPYKERSHQ